MDTKPFKLINLNNKDGNKTQMLTRRSRMITPTKWETPEGKIITSDPNDIKWECYNYLKEEIIFLTYHPFEPHLFPLIICKPEDWVILPHRYYTVSTKSGRPPHFLSIFGDQIGKGMKLPSRPSL